MAISKTLEYGHVNDLWLDPKNPRIGRENRDKRLEQDDLLEIMSKWTLDELVDSFLVSGGFWTQDALMVVREKLQGQSRLVVVEGNRRLAAIKLMQDAVLRGQTSHRWLSERLESVTLDADDPLFTRLPYLVADHRDDVDAYLGFRHVTGIKEWRPAEKAEFIAKLIDEKNLSYKEVAKKIGSRSDTVRQHYVSFKILLQMEKNLDDADWSAVEDKFSVLFLSIRSQGVRDFLGIDLKSEPKGKHDPIPTAKKGQLASFVGWLFGSDTKRPLVKESRQVDKFGEILAEPKAVEYLQSTEQPKFEVAYSLTRESADVVIEALGQAELQLQLALRELGRRGQDENIREASWPVIRGGLDLAKRNKGDNLKKAQELLSAT